MTASELLPLIKATDKADRFSENLYKWVKKHGHWGIETAWSRHSYIDGREVGYSVEETNPQHVLIGRFGDDWFYGYRLSDILCNGVKANRYAFGRDWRIDRLPGWWQGYIEGGKCFIDPQHRYYHDAERWDTGKNTRSCLWCGNFRQERKKKTKVYYIWE